MPKLLALATLALFATLPLAGQEANSIPLQAMTLPSITWPAKWWCAAGRETW